MIYFSNTFAPLFLLLPCAAEKIKLVEKYSLQHSKSATECVESLSSLNVNNYYKENNCIKQSDCVDK